MEPVAAVFRIAEAGMARDGGATSGSIVEGVLARGCDPLAFRKGEAVRLIAGV